MDGLMSRGRGGIRIKEKEQRTIVWHLMATIMDFFLCYLSAKWLNEVKIIDRQGEKERLKNNDVIIE